MFTRILTGGAVAALAGAAMLAISASSASAFTLSSPSLEQIRVVMKARSLR